MRRRISPIVRSKTIHRAFTLIELVTVIVILGVLSVVAVPVYLDYSRDAKIAACKGSLGAMRSSIANFRAHSTVPSGGGTLAYPTLGELTTIGVVLQSEIPPNPYDGDGTPNNVVDATGVTKGLVVGTSKGWAYDPVTGQIWANSNSSGGKGWNENAF